MTTINSMYDYNQPIQHYTDTVIVFIISYILNNYINNSRIKILHKTIIKSTKKSERPKVF